MTADASPSLFDPEERPLPRRRRSPWPWIVVLVVVLALVAGAAVGAEAIARDVVQGGVRTLVASQVDLPPGVQPEVEVEGLVLPQLIAGTLDTVTVSAADVSVGSFTGDVSVTATGVPIRGDAPAAGGSATVTLDETELRGLLSNIDGFPADSVGIAVPNVTASTELSLFGAAIPIGLSLTPGAEDGDLVLTPAAFQVAGVEASAEALRAQFGGIADAVLRDWRLCVADQLPSALTLTAVDVDDAQQVVARFDIDGAVVTDRALLQPGTCA
jgi:hypothetical protein